jgi:hypothetical protein
MQEEHPMRRDRLAQRPASVFSGPERWRLMTGILMLVVLCMLIWRTSDPGIWRWLAADKAPAPQTAAPAPKVSKPTGPTDEDSEEADAAREEYQAVTDGGLQLGPEEMHAYDRLVFWVQNQTFARLWQRAKRHLAYTYLYDDAKNRRGQLIALEVDVRLVRDAGKTDRGVALYEAWGAADQSLGRLYDLIVVDFPKPVPVDATLQQKAKFAGYFLKLKEYQPGTAQPGQRPEKAPVLIGRLEWTPEPAPLVDNTPELIWGAGLLVVVAIGTLFWFLFFRPKRERRSAPPRVVASSSGDAMPIDEWLEQRNFGGDNGENRLDHRD